jgi:hypothetical protein
MCLPSGPSEVFTAFENAAGHCLDVQNKNMLVSDKRLNTVLTFHFSEIF